MNRILAFSNHAQAHSSAPSEFWARILKDESLERCNDLEKLLIGCELIAALDDVSFSLAA